MEKFDMNNGRLGLSSVETLYSYVQKVFIKSRKSEEKSKMLRIAMEIKTELSISSGKVLCLQITDDNDCAFFYSLFLTQEDFRILKNQQALLVDFDHFPSQLMKLFEVCRFQDITNKFILVLDEEDSMIIQSPQECDKGCIFLKVIETNNFKNLCHLSLKVKQGSDTDIKNHMSLKIANLNDKLAEEIKNHKISEHNLSEALKALDIKTKELSEIQLKVAEEKNNLKLETSHQISEEREKITKLQLEWQQKLEMERSQLIMQYQKQLSDMNEQINLLTFNNKNLYESRCQQDTSMKEKSYQIESLEKQVLHLTQETTLLRKQNAQLDQDYHEKDKTMVSLKTKLAVAEQELKDKAKLLDKQQELLKSANEQKIYLEEALNEKDTHLQRKQSAVQTLSSDLMKCNEIISKLQTELAASKAKMKLRTDIALEQEKVLEKKCLQLTAQEQTIADLNEKVTKLKEELLTAKAQLEETSKKIEEKDLIIKKNDNVINWLNRKLTESCSGSSKSPNLISSSRTESDSLFTSQPKGNVSNLTKGWPQWLVNSVAGCNTSGSNSTEISNTNSTNSQLPVNSLQGNSQSNSSNNQVHKLEIPARKEEKISEIEQQIETEKKTRGLDPKYFQSSGDKDFVINPQILKSRTNSNNLKTNSTSKPASGRKEISAYFPKTLTL